MPNGMVANTNQARFQGLRRNRWPAIRLVISKTNVDRIPLHSSATRSEMPGRRKTSPSRNTGTSVIFKNTKAASAEVCCRKASIHCVRTVGNGTEKTRNKTGKATACMSFAPKQKKPPPTKKQRKDVMVRARESFRARGPTWYFSTQKAVSADNPASQKTAASTGELRELDGRDSFCSQIR